MNKARLGKPSLVRETSRVAVSQMLKQPISSFQRLTGIGMKSQDALKGIVLEESLDSQLRKIAVSTAHTKKNRAPFRHLLLHGKWKGIILILRRQDIISPDCLSLVKRLQGLLELERLCLLRDLHTTLVWNTPF